MHKTLIPKEFTSGTVLLEYNGKLPANIEPQNFKIMLKYPSRLEAISIDESKIAFANDDNIYTAGQIDFCVDIFNTITVSIRDDKQIYINKDFARSSLALHSARLMQKALHSNGFDINIKQDISLMHCGIGSSSAIIQGVGAAINELYGNPFAPLDLIHYLCSNHGEEAIGDNKLIHVQSVGGSGICGHFDGGLIINAGKAIPIFQKILPEEFWVVLGIPHFYEKNSGKTMISAEIDHLAPFIESGEKYAKDICYRLINEVIPALVINDFKPCKDLIFDVRYKMCSNYNCSFYYRGILDIASKLYYLKDDPEIEFLSLSSVGPAFFIITKNPAKAERIFSELNMANHRFRIHNARYQVIERIPI